MIGNPTINTQENTILVDSLTSITDVDQDNDFIIIHDSSSSGNKLKKITPKDFIESLKIITE